MTAFTRAASVLAAVVLLAGLTLTTMPPAHAAAGVTVTNAQGTATADPDYATEVAVRGSGFQSIPKGFGGVYVVFGWIDGPAGGDWRPSRGGVAGADYRYVPDSETQDNQGFMRFIAFPGSETEGAAHAAMSADGSWSVSMLIPGAVFQSRDRSGNTSSVDCREVTCGVITIGAHGVKNANNETFTPVRFAAPGSAPAGGTSPEASAAAPGDVRVGLSSSSVRAGTSIVFTGQGFEPGEQIVAALDDGVTAIGPLTAGSRGEVAGALPVPRDTRGGTHLVSLTGAASGAIAEAEVAIEADPATTAAASVDDRQVPQWAVIALLVAIVIALLLVIASGVTSLRRALARRKARRVDESRAPTSAPSASAVGHRVREELVPAQIPPAAEPEREPGSLTAETPDTAPTEVLSAAGSQR